MSKFLTSNSIFSFYSMACPPYAGLPSSVRLCFGLAGAFRLRCQIGTLTSLPFYRRSSLCCNRIFCGRNFRPQNSSSCGIAICTIRYCVTPTVSQGSDPVEPRRACPEWPAAICLPLAPAGSLRRPLPRRFACRPSSLQRPPLLGQTILLRWRARRIGLGHLH